MQHYKVWPQILLYALLGLVAGAAGAAIVLQYLPKFQPITTEFRQTLTRRPASLENLKIEDISGNLVYFIKPKPQAEFTALEDRVGVGVALTSDGLVATALSFSEKNFPKAVSSSRVIYDVEPVKGKNGKIAYDQRLGLTFVKIKESALKPVPFVRFEEITQGQEAISLTLDGRMRFHRLQALINPLLPADFIEAAEKLTGFITADNEPQEGTPLYTKDGALLGIALERGRVIPAELLQAALLSFIKEGTISRTYLGIYGIDLSATAPLNKDLPKHGFLLRQGKGGPAVVSGSPAAVAGLRAGDILIALEGERLDGSPPLALLLARYPAGTEVELTILRAGQEEKVKVVLGKK